MPALRNKYGAVRTTVGGIAFASRKEARRYSELRLLERAGEISGLELQPRFPIVVNGVKVCTYVADFRYLDKKTDKFITEDVKSEATKTPIYRLKKKLVEALFSVVIIEV